MANPNPKTEHLESTQWQPGQSGNPAGKPKGTKHLSSWIRELMENEGFEHKLENGTIVHEAPVQAIVHVLIQKALRGDMKAFDLLGKYGYGSRIDITSEDRPLPTPIMGGLSRLSDAELEAMLASRKVTNPL